MKVSVIIPVYNNTQGLQDTLESLIKQNFSEKDFEIIVVDNNSQDNTFKIAEKFSKKHNNIIVKTEKKQSSYAARNKGILASQGEIIAFVDADITVEQNWLNKVVKRMEKTDYLACKIEVFTEKENIFALYDKITAFPVKRYLEKENFSPTACLVIKREIINKLGLFDNRMISNADREFGNRVYRANYKMDYAEDIVLKHPARDSFKSLRKKHFRIGRGIKQASVYHKKYFYTNFWKIIFSLFYSKIFKFNKTIKNYSEKQSLFVKIKLFLVGFSVKFFYVCGYFYQSFKRK